MRRYREGRLDRPFVDELINLARWPIGWLWKECDPSDRWRGVSSQTDYGDAARELAELGRSYEWIEAAFTYAHKNRLRLVLKGHNIVPIWVNRDHVRYDAYDRLRDVVEVDRGHSESIIHSIRETINATVQLRGRSDGALNRGLFSHVNELTTKLLDGRFRLPGNWQFPTGSVAEYRSILTGLCTLSLIHFFAQTTALEQGLARRSDQLIVMQRTELTKRLSRYLGLDRQLVCNIVEELTFGHGLHSPDIALQPLVPIDQDQYTWAPCLVLHSSFERNLLVLLNRFPRSREAYSRLSQERETIMRCSMRRGLANMGLRFWSGKVRGWGNASEVDLAIIDERQASCLLLELKAFLAPADPGEICTKAEAIEKGVEQVKLRRKALSVGRQSLNGELGIDNSFTVRLAVASESSAGCGGMACVGNVAVVRSSHLVDRIRSEGGLKSVCEWLSKRNYLPCPGQDYEQLSSPVTIGDWTLDWYEIKPLTDNYR